MFRQGDHPLPSIYYALGLFGTTGVVVPGLTGVLHNYPFFFRPHRHLFGLAVGLMTGYAVQSMAQYSFDRIRRVRAYKIQEAKREKEQIEGMLKEYEAETGKKVHLY